MICELLLCTYFCKTLSELGPKCKVIILSLNDVLDVYDVNIDNISQQSMQSITHI